MNYMNERTAAANLAAVQSGRLSSISPTTAALVAGDNPVIGPSTKRRAILFMPPSWGCVWLSPDVPSQVGVGIKLDQNDPPLLLRQEDVGDLVHRAFRAWHTMLDIGLRPLPAVTRSTQAQFATHALVTVTAPAVAGQCVVLEGGSVSVIPSAGGMVTVSFGATPVSYVAFQGGAQLVMNRPLVAPANTAVNVTLPDPGVGVSAFLTVTYTMVPTPTITVYEVLGP